ncbi:hypothetical protein FIU87_11900 [Bacillus sp. THAF10]|uniref:cold-shock protein n=1 Tax=Bacillus sp. THAF10 TaxID=2587848 RepID=UPI0012680257|nr:cold-shock protein [Bacillus sp. THAF10]QFT89351.1 hypothetical protein FIU87_11900 [Bacillus sp. THAF10]
MAFGRREAEEIVTEETKVWECASESCKGWMRDNFRNIETERPICPLCQSDMTQGTKVLAVINNYSMNQKA